MWTQRQLVNLECAKEIINDLMAIYTFRIHSENKKENPSEALITTLRDKRTQLGNERAALRVIDEDENFRISQAYGEIVSAWRNEQIMRDLI